MSGGVGRQLTLADILDLRAYERVRDGYRRAVIEHKRARRIALGELLTLVFESLDTIRFQVQEMVRAERILSDEAVQHELDVYNALLPAPGELSATLFLDLTSEDQLRHWLPRLVGIESAVAVEVSGGLVTSVPEAGHAEALTRETVTSAVHYVRFAFTPGEVEQFARGEVALVADHHEYEARTVLGEATKATLLEDLEGRTELMAMG